MRKIAFCFITIVLIFIFGSIGLAQELPSLTESSPPTPVSPVPASPKLVTPPVSEPLQYSNPTYGFSFNYPVSWKPYTDVEGALKIEFDLFEGEYIIASFCVYIEDTELSLSRYAMVVEEWMVNPQNMPEYNKISEEAVTVGNLPAIKRLYTWTRINTENNSRIPIKAIDIYLVKDKKGYILEGQVTQDLFDRILPDLSVMFDNFAPGGLPVTVSIPTTPELPEVITTTTDTSTSSGTTESVFKYCPYCGIPLQPDYQFCPGCGKPIPTQRSITKKENKSGSAKEGKDRGINYSLDLISIRGFPGDNFSLKGNNFSSSFRGMNRSVNTPFKSFKPAFISRGFGNNLIRLFSSEPSLPWAVSKRVIPSFYYNSLPGSVIKRVSPQNILTRSIPVKTSDFSFVKEWGKGIALNSNIGTTFRGGAINQLGSSLKNSGKEITLKMIVSQTPLSEKTWVLRSTKRGAQENVSMGSSIGRISSKIGSLVVDQTRSSSSIGGCFSDIGQGINLEIGTKREVDTLPSLTPVAPQTAPAIPGTPPPATGPEGIVSPTPGAPAQGGITLTPPGQPVPTQPGPGGIALPTPGTPQEPQVIWKQYSLNQAFSHNPLISGYLEYPSTWLVNLDSFNRNVTFSEDASGLTSLTLFPGLMGQFSSAQDLAQQMTYLLQQQVPDLSILNQEFKIVPTPGSGAIEVTEGKINLQGGYQGTTFRFNLESYVIYTGVYGPSSGMGYVILTQSPQNIFVEKEQKYFNRMLLSYKRALGVVK